MNTTADNTSVVITISSALNLMVPTTASTATSDESISQQLQSCRFYEFMMYSVVELVVCIVGAAGLNQEFIVHA